MIRGILTAAASLAAGVVTAAFVAVLAFWSYTLLLRLPGGPPAGVKRVVSATIDWVK
jgi:hypothetical protein